MLSLVPLGDQAALVYLADEAAAARFAAAVRLGQHPWVVDVVQAYASVAVFYHPDQTTFANVQIRLRQCESQASEKDAGSVGRLHRIPCCYERQLDLQRVATHCGVSTDTVIQLHAGTEYAVYAIGFCPGFPYLGYLPDELARVPRLETPRLRVEPGSVGLTGRQTGVYTELRPGGWNLIGRTPLQLVDVRDGYFPLRTGDHVRFERIDEAEYQRLEGTRL